MTLSMLALGFHSFALCIHAFAENYHFTYITPIEIEFRGYEFGGSFIYLTHVTNLSHILYYSIVVINHFFKFKFVRRFSDFLFVSLVLPLGLLVCGMYYGLHSLGSDLVFPTPKGFVKNDPAWLDFIVHVNVVIFPFVDILISKHSYPNRLHGVITLLSVLVCYLGVILLVNFKTGQWVYGILGKINMIQRTMLICGCGVVAVLFYMFGEMCNRIVKKSKQE